MKRTYSCERALLSRAARRRLPRRNEAGGKFGQARFRHEFYGLVEEAQQLVALHPSDYGTKVIWVDDRSGHGVLLVVGLRSGAAIS